jgi:hypothetical protein
MDRSPQSAAAAGRGGGPFDSTVIDRCAGGGLGVDGMGKHCCGGGEGPGVCRRLGRFFFFSDVAGWKQADGIRRGRGW